MSLLRLPEETVLLIWEYIDSLHDRNTFLQIHRRFYNLLDPLLYPYALKIGGRHPILSAARRGHAAAVQKLIKESADINMSGPRLDAYPAYSNNWSALAFAASRGYEAVVKILLASDGVNVNITTSDGQTPLNLAATNGRDTIIPLLLAHEDIEPNVKNNHGRTALIEASFRGYTAVTEQLLASKKVDPNMIDDFLPPIPLGVVEPEYDLDRHGYGWLINKEEFEPSREAWKDVMEKRKRGRTALSWAAERGHERIVKLLLADSRVQVDTYGYMTMDWADKLGHTVIRELLLEFTSDTPREVYKLN